MALVSKGSTFKMGAAVESLAVIGEIVSIDFPGLKVEEIEATHLGTTGVRSYIPAQLNEVQAPTVELNYTPAAYSTLCTARDALGTKYFALVFNSPLNQTVSFQGFVTEVKQKVGKHNELQGITLTVRPTPLPAITDDD